MSESRQAAGPGSSVRASEFYFLEPAEFKYSVCI